MKIIFRTATGARQIECGNFLYSNLTDGTTKLVFLEKENRQDPDNQPIGAVTGVLEYWTEGNHALLVNGMPGQAVSAEDAAALGMPQSPSA
ncbi:MULTISPECIES: hypothetical protein [unclassified Parvimonas]|uniref:hypothetical protein n=1 Tax=unclassified Parvimonas TaxID=1151464 RepID=UPI002B49F981|nr:MULTISPECIES: hypothetical protein [unclassified Parvimonas]MEB3025874.1 hypothetical protein [Parvimonas sp. M13]MEB3059356.1 hypothetical protein [Parvimonas sp. D9]